MNLEHPSVSDILDDFTILDTWQDRYAYLIELGHQMPPLPSKKRCDTNKIRGCMSATWLWCWLDFSGETSIFYLYGDSESLIVKGLIAVLRAICHKQTLPTILKSSIEETFVILGLKKHLSAQRTNGLQAMIEHVKSTLH